jgi:hypothetical protein
MMGFAVVLAVIGATLAPASPDARLEPNPAAVIRALVARETGGGACLLRLRPNGVVYGATRCDLSPTLRRAKHWRRTDDCICLLDDRHALLLAFRAIGGGKFRAEGVEAETLLMRLLPETSMPMSR